MCVEGRGESIREAKRVEVFILGPEHPRHLPTPRATTAAVAADAAAAL